MCARARAHNHTLTHAPSPQPSSPPTSITTHHGHLQTKPSKCGTPERISRLSPSILTRHTLRTSRTLPHIHTGTWSLRPRRITHYESTICACTSRHRHSPPMSFVSGQAGANRATVRMACTWPVAARTGLWLCGTLTQGVLRAFWMVRARRSYSVTDSPTRAATTAT